MTSEASDKDPERSGAMRRAWVCLIASDGAGVAAESLALTALTQFPELDGIERELWPFCDPAELERLIERAQALRERGIRVLCVSTLALPSTREALDAACAAMGATHLDLFSLSLPPLEAALGLLATPAQGKARAGDRAQARLNRERALDWALAHDDGSKTRYEGADALILGVSRSGKTPVCIWLALHYGLKVGNYPITSDEADRGRLPDGVRAFTGPKLLLTLSPERLSQIREERLPNSRYASIAQCEAELRQASRLAESLGALRLSSEGKSVEEIAAAVIKLLKISPREIF